MIITPEMIKLFADCNAFLESIDNRASAKIISLAEYKSQRQERDKAIELH